MEYKFEAIGQIWTTKRLTEKATLKANELSRDGWRLIKVNKGWSGFFFSTLYLVFERNT